MGRNKGSRGRPSTNAVPPGRPRRRFAGLLCASAVILAGMVYANALDNPFVYDDHVTVVDNATIRDLGNLRGIAMRSLFRPVINLSYAVDYALWGLDPFGFHLSSVALHMLNVALLFALALRLAEDVGLRTGREHRPLLVASAAAFLFGVHPLMSEAVGYVSGRSELLCSAFVLLGLLSLRAALLGGGLRWYITGCACFVLAAGSKEIGALLPLLVLAWDRLLAAGDAAQRRRRLLQFHLPLVGLVVAAGLARVMVYLVVEGGGQEDLVGNALTESIVSWRYLLLLVLPLSQSVVHSVRAVDSVFDPVALTALAGLIFAAVLLFRARHQWPLGVFGAFWFALLLAPSHVIPLAEAMAEHRTYTPGIGFFLGVGAVFAAVMVRLEASEPAWRRCPALMTLPILLVLGAATVARNRVWSDPVTLWADAATKAPKTWAAAYQHGNALRLAGRCNEAVAAYRHAIRLLPKMVEAHLNLAICLAETGRYNEARDVLLAARDHDADNPKIYNNLASLALVGNRADLAEQLYLESISRAPGDPRAYQLLARLYENVLHDPARAVEACRRLRAVAGSMPGVDDCIQRNLARLQSDSRLPPGER